MEHMGKTTKKGKGKSKESTPEEILDSNIEEANSIELQQASLARLLTKGGELVEKGDLWDCLFGAVSQKNNNRSSIRSLQQLDQEVRGHLGAEAAEERLATQRRRE
jgi:E3 ubiquitin-protein ligase SHPRH